LCNRLNEVAAPALTMEQRHQDPAAGFAFPAVRPPRRRTLSRSSRWSRRGARPDTGFSLGPDHSRGGPPFAGLTGFSRRAVASAMTGVESRTSSIPPKQIAVQRMTPAARGPSAAVFELNKVSGALVSAV